MRISDWSSDVCSADLLTIEDFVAKREVIDYRVMERLRRRVDAIVNDPKTAEALKPYYRFLCKRPLSSDEFYPTFNRPNVELVDVSDTKRVERLTEKGFVANGKEYEVDCMIFASGFEVTRDRKSTRLNSSHSCALRIPSSALKNKPF